MNLYKKIKQIREEKMKVKIFVLVLTVLAIFDPAILQSKEINPEEIVKKSQETIKLDGAEMISVMKIYDDKGNERVRKIAQISKLYDSGSTEKKLMKFLEPADVKGTGFLTYDYENKDDDMWLYMPSLRKTRRIVSSEKSKSFMGSEFTYSDISSFTISDFEYEYLGEEEINGEPCYKIEQLPKSIDIEDEYGFSKKTAYFSKNDNLIRKAVFYDIDGELYKILEVKEVKEIDKEKHKFRATHIVMKNQQNGRSSELIVEKIQLNRNVDDEYFTLRYLERE